MIYFDNAATTFPKPTAVRDAVLDCIENWCGNPGRGAHTLSLKAADRVYTCREKLALFVGLSDPTRIVFTGGATAALNIAIKGTLRAGDHVLCSELEHNAVWRPLQALRREGRITVDTFPVVGLSKEKILQEVAKRVKKSTRAIVCTQMSNICSVTLPIAEIGAFCRAKGLFFIVDAAQSAGHLPIDMEAMCIDALALPAHKGLYGIPGCGALALGKRLLPKPLLEGGSGVNSRAAQMPDELPERLEAGTLPLPAIAGLLGGLSFLESIDPCALQSHENGLFLAARERIEGLPQYEVIARDAVGPVLLFRHTRASAVAVARKLSENGIAVRAGLHCAPLAHQALRTGTEGGVRLSFSYRNSETELDTLLRILHEI
ncbi:MAG: aminotransferase class V-fold PLP-dependent enzyme [Clostridia bacterium]|nr:aminotransferase class V-fold PLP-dependent enzyme [Clostridia bacterium]